MSNDSNNNSFLKDILLAGLKVYVGDENYAKIEMIGRMVLEEDYIQKCDFYFTGRGKSLDCVVKDNYGNISKHSMKTDSNKPVYVDPNGRTDVCYRFGDFVMKIRTYSKPYKGAYFKVDVFTKNGPTATRKKARGK